MSNAAPISFASACADLVRLDKTGFLWMAHKNCGAWVKIGVVLPSRYDLCTEHTADELREMLGSV